VPMLAKPFSHAELGDAVRAVLAGDEAPEPECPPWGGLPWSPGE
jgi:hypothetical protein